MAWSQSAMALSCILIRNQSAALDVNSRAVCGSTIPNASRDKSVEASACVAWRWFFNPAAG